MEDKIFKPLDPTNLLPKYYQIKKIIEKSILGEFFNHGDTIPSEVKLSKKFGVTHVTVNRAIMELVNEGLLYREKGKGTFVKSKLTPPSPGKRSDIICFGVDIFIGDKGHYSPYVSEVLEGIVAQCHKKGINLVLPPFTNGIMNIHNAIDLGIKGMICFGKARSELNINQFKESGLPFIIVNRIAENEGINYIETDHFKGGYIATKHLIDLGHKRIGYIYDTKTMMLKSIRDRFEGYKLALQENGLDFSDELVVPGNPKKLLSLSNIPTGIFASSDLIAAGAIRAIREAHIRVPEDISVVGFDDLRLSSIQRLQITTVRQRLPELGSLAVEKLLSIIRGTHTGFVQEKLDVELVIRKSTHENSFVTSIKKQEEVKTC